MRQKILDYVSVADHASVSTTGAFKTASKRAIQ